MYMNNVPEGTPYRSNTYRFNGLNRGNYTYNGEFEDMTNMSTDEYPCAAPRGSREVVVDLSETVQAVCAPDVSVSDSVEGFTGIMDGAFYYNGVVKSTRFVLPASFDWSVARYNTSYIINGYDPATGNSLMYCYNAQTDKFSLPDNVMDDLIVTAGTDSTGDFLCTFREGFNPVRSYSCTLLDGTVLDANNFFKKYNIWLDVNIFTLRFQVGDEVSIKGFPRAAENVGQVWYYYTSREEVRQISGDFFANNTVSAEDYPQQDIPTTAITSAVVKAFKTRRVTISGSICYIHYIYFDLTNKNGNTVHFTDMSDPSHDRFCMGVKLANRMRTFDNIAVHNNRLWGSSPNGAQLFGSSSTDIFDFSGSSLETDELYYALIPSTIPGKWTGLCEYEDVLLAFKDSSVTVIYGNSAANYSAKVINGIGCIDHRSIQCTPNGVIFLGYNGFYMYTGARVPQLISDKLYRSRYVSAISGFDGNKYYAAAVRADGTHELLTYDLRYRLWHIQDDGVYAGMFTFKGRFYLCDQSKLYLCDSGSEAPDWSFTTCKTHFNTLDSKSLQSIWIRAELTEGSFFIVSTSTDGGEWLIHRGGAYSDNQSVFLIPVHLNRGSSFRIRIYGHGRIIFHELELNYPLSGRRYKTTNTEEAKLDSEQVVDYEKNDDLILY